jgi:hypothetical protein
VSPGLAPPLTSAVDGCSRWECIHSAAVEWEIHRSHADNFIRSVPIVLLAALLRWDHGSTFRYTFCSDLRRDHSGCTLCGTPLWEDSTVTRAALVQLSVPILAALGGVVILSEITSALISATVTLGGIALQWRAEEIEESLK